MGLQKFSVRIKEQINSMSREELEGYIVKLKRSNDSKSMFVSSSVLTSNTVPIVQSIRFNDLLIRLCEDRLEKMGVE